MKYLICLLIIHHFDLGCEHYNSKWPNSTGSVGAYEPVTRYLLTHSSCKYRKRNYFVLFCFVYVNVVQGIPGLQAAQNAAAAQQQNVVMVQPSQNLTSVTSSPVGTANGCKFLFIILKMIYSLMKMFFS